METVDVWKQFEQNPVTHSAAHHLLAIADLRETHGYARVSDVAKCLNITRGSASLTLKALKHRGLVEEDENRFLHLSHTGTLMANTIRGKKFLLHKFMVDVLGVDPATADIDACKVEHLISHDTARRLTKFLRFIESDSEIARQFLNAWQSFNVPCGHDPRECPSCHTECLSSIWSDEQHGPSTEN